MSLRVFARASTSTVLAIRHPPLVITEQSSLSNWGA
jgi:hypothetical protein